MFIVFLEFSRNRSEAKDFMSAHNDWIRRGFDEAVFLLVGSLQPHRGGAILARATTREDLETRLASDPFVQRDIVTAEIFELTVAKTDARLAFLSSDGPPADRSH